MRIVFLGLSISSSWGNGHATTYRALIRALSARGHQVTFVERERPWYAANRDLPDPSFCRAVFYSSVDELERLYADDLRQADAVIVGSYVPDGIAVGDLVLRTARGLTAFYDIDTPVTLARIGVDIDYIAPRQVPGYDLYLSFTGGPTLDRLERVHGARMARPLYCSVDPELYYPEPGGAERALYDCGYLGTYSDDRQPVLDELLLSVARRWAKGRFVVAGPQYPERIAWPPNVLRLLHLDPSRHRGFYGTLRFTLNVTRRDMVRAGYSPSVRLFEAAACGTAIISDRWPGIETFFTPGSEILLASNGEASARYIRGMDESERRAIGARARAKVLRMHTAADRARELEAFLSEAGVPMAEAKPA